MDEFVVRDKIIFIHSKIFNKFPNVVKKVRSMSGVGCGFLLEKLCSSECVLALYLDITTIPLETKHAYGDITPESLEWPYYENILGFLTLDMHGSHGEIYNVCTNPYTRGMGVAKKIFKATTDMFNFANLWIGIKLDNPSWNAALRVYVGAGFTNPVITNITPSGTAIPFPVLSLVFSSNTLSQSHPPKYAIERIIENATYLRAMYLSEQGISQIRVHASTELLKDVYDMVSSKVVEYGGGMEIAGKTNDAYELSIPLNTITEGDPQTLTVNTPTCWMSWHTHPYICYSKEQCYIGWPSGLDMGFVVRQYALGCVAHIVFTVEGVYTIQLSRGMMQFMSLVATNQQCIDAITIIVAAHFTHIEDLRKIKTDPSRIECVTNEDISCLVADSDKMNIMIDKYLTLASTYTFQDLLQRSELRGSIPGETAKVIEESLECLKLTDEKFPVFMVKFSQWNTLVNDGLFITLTYLEPPAQAKCSVYDEGRESEKDMEM